MSLDESAPNLPKRKLPFWNTVTLAYSIFFRRFSEVLRAFWPWLTVLAVLTAITSWQQWSWMLTLLANLRAGDMSQMMAGLSQPFALLALGCLNIFCLLLAGVSIAIAWHRLMILDEQPGFSIGNIMTKNFWRYVGVGIAICLIAFLPATAILWSTLYLLSSVKAGWSSAATGFLALIVVAIVVYVVAVSVRLSTLLPARAIGELDLNFREAWKRTRGNTGRLFWGLLLTTIAPLLPLELALTSLRDAAFSEADLALRVSASKVIFVVYYLLSLPISIGFLSLAYRQFFPDRLERAS